MNNNNIPDRSAGLGPISRVSAPSLSFGQHPGLVERLRAEYPDARINTEDQTWRFSVQCASGPTLPGYDYIPCTGTGLTSSR